ncbi:MAG: GNAT family N-acetyltransferase [Aestuariivirga sp.]
MVGNSGISVRKLQRSEASTYCEFRIYALKTFPTAFTTTAAEAEALPAQAYEQRIERQGDRRHFIVGVFDNGRLIGTAAVFGQPLLAESHKANLVGMAVHEDFQGRGIGRLIVEGVLAVARAIPEIRQIILHVTKGNIAAERFYRSAGFETFGIEPRATIVDGVAYDEYLMIKLFD